MYLHVKFCCLTILVLMVFTCRAEGQQPTSLLVITNKKAIVLFDGEPKGEAEPNIPFKILTMEGEHYVQASYQENGASFDKSESIVLYPGKQKIVRLNFEGPTRPVEDILLAELNFLIPGSIAVELWKKDNQGSEYPYPSHYAAFDKGDEIVVNTQMTNKNGTNVVEIATHPDNVVKYSNRGFSELRDLHIKVEERAIYRFTFATNHVFDRNCILRISRKPGIESTNDFNTNVSFKKIYRPVAVIEPTIHWVNSGSNATFYGGKSRLVIPISLPPNTVFWFYRFSASRNKDDVENVRANFRLLGELSKLLLVGTGIGKTLSPVIDIGVEQLAIPPGANMCDIFLLDYSNVAPFETKTNYSAILQGTRQNLVSGNVKIDCCTQGQYYLGVRNPAPIDGINVSLEVTAIIVSEEYVMEAQEIK